MAKKTLSAALILLSLALPARALSPERAVLTALSDADKQAKEDQPFLRYLFSPDDTPGYLALRTPALRLHVNLISTQLALAYPLQVVPGLWRVDIRDYGWDRDTWEKLADIDPYFHRNQIQDVVVERVRFEDVEVEVEVDQPYGYYDPFGRFVQTEIRRVKRVEKQRKRVVQKRVVRKRSSQLYVPQGAAQLAGLALLTQSNQPIARADWFLVQGARQVSLTNRNNTGVGYYDWLQLNTLDDYFRLIGREKKAAERTQIRAVIGESGVAAQNREATREGVTNGALWTTFEVADQSGRGVAIQELREGELNTAASEFYAPLLNGLPVTFLADAKGVRQDSVPDDIAGNRSPLNVGNDTRVHVNLACMQCHNGQVLLPIPEDVRATYTGRLGVLSNDKGVSLELSRQYGADLALLLGRDRTLYQNALTATTGKSPKEAATLYSQAFTDYAYGRVTIQQAALEIGVSPLAFKKALKDAATRLGRSDFRTDPFLLDNPVSIPRLNWEDAFQDTQDLVYGILNQNPSVNDGGVGGSREDGPGAKGGPKLKPPEIDR